MLVEALMDGAAGMVNIPPDPPPPAPKPPPGFEDAVAATARILAAGMKPAQVSAETLIDAGRTRHREVRAAFEEGIAVAGLGFFDKGMIEEAWRFSASRRALVGNPPGMNLIGKGVMSSDPRTKGRDGWEIAGVQGDRAWLRSLGKGERIDLIVRMDTLTAMAGDL